jgi:hypothetical protein
MAKDEQLHAKSIDQSQMRKNCWAPIWHEDRNGVKANKSLELTP